MRFVLALLATNLEASLALRAAFVMQAGFMLLNNLLFFVFWWVMFERFEQIRGWRIEDMAVLYGICAAGYGVAAVLAGGVPSLARRIEEGELDPMLTLPRSVLVQAAAAETNPAGWGDIASGLVLVALSGRVDLWHAPVVLLAMLASGLVFAAFGVVMHSAAFWLGRVQALARQGTELVITFGVYPPVLFGG
ncbi:MAG: ABC-2 family transporter protein, partial [Myxococcales bacterium]|nr:ABC-2 family transporter protein [Myxococcales bacterium]